MVIGAGPAGLTAAYTLAKAGKQVVVLESDPDYVGGISRTVESQGFRFDIGGHRFFSKSKEVNALWDELLPLGMRLRSRKSRIFYRQRFFSYPLRPFEVFSKLGPVESVFSLASYLKTKIFPHRRTESVEGWLINSFGRRLYLAFFKSYTEKVWGIPCAEISSSWAAQRIKGLSLKAVVWNWLFPNGKIKSLIEEFKYPDLGPGMVWSACAGKIRDLGGEIWMGRQAQRYFYDPSSRKWTVEFADPKGEAGSVCASHLICSAPLGEVITRISAPLDEEVLVAARKLRHRDFIQVALGLKGPELFPDNWLYIHDPGVSLGRVQNFRAWSPEMVPEGDVFSYGAEYFCARGDSIWRQSDEELIALALRELKVLGLLREQEVIVAKVIRQPQAYPLYDADYQENVELIRQAVNSKLANIHFVGRNGMHKYNNQDHAMMTGMIVAENILAGRQFRDPWQVNQDAEYIESSVEAVPARG